MDRNKKLNGLKITYIGEASLNDIVGGAVRLRTTLNLLNGMGIKVNLITYYRNSDNFSIKREKINPLLQSTTIGIPKNLPKFIKAFSALPVFLYAWKSAKKCDLIFANFVFILSSIPAIILSKMFNKPIILDYYDVVSMVPNIVPNIVYKYFAKNADCVFGISPQLVNRAMVYGCKNAIYVPNFVDPNRFKLDLRDREKIREELGIKKDEFVIGYAGSFGYIEGIPFLFQAFKNLKKKHLKIKLAVMGDIRSPSPKGADDIPKLVEDMNLKNEAILIPLQPHEEVPKFLSTFDILCCPKIDCYRNRWIIPIKIVEYLSMGLPTVASAVGGIPDTIEDGVDGLLVKPGDVKDLEEKLEWVILNPERAKEIGKNGRKTAIEKYSYEAIEDTIREAICEIVDRKKGNKLGD